jgi:heterodisulfide reductase subunit C
LPQTRKKEKIESEEETKLREEVKKETQETDKKAVLRIAPESTCFKYELKKVPGAERLMLCFQCGTCTADCPVSRFNESYRPRKILRMAQLGMKDQVLRSDTIWLCAACYTCVDHCPQDVEIANVLRALRNIAVKEGVMPPVFKELASAIMETGYAYKIPELRIKKRVETALPPLPKGNISDIEKLFKVTGFAKVLEGSGGSS